MNTRLKVTVSLFAIAALLIWGCSNEANRDEPVMTTTDGTNSTSSAAAEAGKRGNALLRVILAVPDAGSADVFADESKTFTDVSYKSVTPYKEVSEELSNFRVEPAGNESAPPLAENSESLEKGYHYTAVVLPGENNEGPILRIISDDITPPSVGKAKVRVIHASPDAGEIDLYAKEEDHMLFDGVYFQTAASYTEVDPMNITLELRPEGQQNTLLMVPNARFEAGKIYTIIIMGRAKGSPRLEATIVEDQLVGNIYCARDEMTILNGDTIGFRPL